MVAGIFTASAGIVAGQVGGGGWVEFILENDWTTLSIPSGYTFVPENVGDSAQAVYAADGTWINSLFDSGASWTNTVVGSYPLTGFTIIGHAQIDDIGDPFYVEMSIHSDDISMPYSGIYFSDTELGATVFNVGVPESGIVATVPGDAYFAMTAHSDGTVDVWLFDDSGMQHFDAGFVDTITPGQTIATVGPAEYSLPVGGARILDTYATNNELDEAEITAIVTGWGWTEPPPPFLETVEGWWDATDYSGSGNLTNKGITGSAIDAVLGTGGSSPTFSAGAFTFNGTNARIAIPDHADLDFGTGQSFTIGLIMTPHATSAIEEGGYFGKGANTFVPHFDLFAQADNESAYVFEVSDVSHELFPDQTLAGSTKRLVMGIRNVTADTVRLNINGTNGTSATDTTTAAITNSDTLWIGRSAIFGHQRFVMYGFFVYRGVPTADQITEIKTYYGIA